jgi:hypothetical protein
MKQLSILLLLALCHRGYAQLPDYYVYLVTGTATITKTGEKPVTIKQKELVYKNDVISLKKGAELTLVDKNASFLVLNTAGNYKGSELVKKGITKSSDGITSRYLKLLFHELLDPNQDFEKLKKENIAGVWGGVSRGNDDCLNRIYPVNGLKTSASFLVFKWHKTSPSSDYSLEVYDGNSKQLAMMPARDTMLPVNFGETLQGKPGTYSWRIMSKDGNCEDEAPIYFEILTPENEMKLIEQLTGTVAGETLEIQLQQIDKLEKNVFIPAALSRYADLAKADPGNKALFKSYIVFLLKYGFDDEARAAWKF